MTAVFCYLLGVKSRNIVVNIVNKVCLNTVDNLKFAAALSYGLYGTCGGRVCLNNPVVGNGNRLVTPLLGTVYNIGGGGNCVLCRHIGVAMKLHPLFALILVCFFIFLQ